MQKNERTGFLSPSALAGMPDETAVLLALSGGADSCALLHLLAGDAKEKGYTLTLAHLNHGIRGEEALRDRRFCEQLAADYGLELCVLDADVPAIARERGMSLETAGRAVRYEYLERLMTERQIPLLATAHHADDQLETLLFRLARGTGLGGLGGIAPCRPFANGFLTRPLLGMPKREILDYCQRNGLTFVTDSSNEDATAARNRIRLEIVPILEQLFDDPQSRAYRLSESLREDEALLSSMADGLLEEARDGEALLVEPIRRAPKPLQRRALLSWCRKQLGAEPERVHLEALCRLLQKNAPQDEVALPGGVVATIAFGRLTVDGTPPRTEPFELPLTEGEITLPSGIRITVEKFENSDKVHNVYTQSCIMVYGLSTLVGEGCVWRSRREGDALLVSGMHKKLRRLYREAGIPVRWRAHLPVLCDREGILWAPFAGCRDGFLGEGDAWLLRVTLPTV